MASTQSTTAPSLPPTNRYITTNDKETGKSRFSRLPIIAPRKELPNGVAFTLDYTTTTHPVKLADDNDFWAYNTHAKDNDNLPPHFRTAGGTVIRHTETPPGGISPMHRTISLDYMVVLEGEVELILDGGETCILKRGDTVVQRGTMHAWRNTSKTEWLRMLSIMIPAEPFEINGVEAKEEFLAPPKV